MDKSNQLTQVISYCFVSFKRNNIFFYKIISVFILSNFLFACSSLPVVPVSFNVKSADNINGYINETSLPVRLRIYQLSELSPFKEATFRELWKLDKQVLGDSLIAVDEITITPHSTVSIKIERQDKTTYIGVFAVFRHPELGKWRAYQKVSSQASSLLSSTSIAVNGNSVRVK